MITLEELYTLNFAFQNDFLNPLEVRKYVSLTKQKKISLVKLLILEKVFTNTRWKEWQKGAQNLTTWPHHPQLLNQENQLVYRKLYTHPEVDKASLQQSYSACQKLAKGKTVPRLYQLLLAKGVLTPETAQTVLGLRKNILVGCIPCKYSIYVETYYPWIKYPCLSCSGRLKKVAGTKGGGVRKLKPQETSTSIQSVDNDDQSDTSALPLDPQLEKEETSLRLDLGEEKARSAVSVTSKKTRAEPQNKPQKKTRHQDGEETREELPKEETNELASPFQKNPDGVQTFGKYTLFTKLGEGGMGVVYKSHDEERERDIALKIMMLSKAVNQDYITRFYKEVKIVSRLDHPHIVPVYEVGEINDIPYYTMDLVDGQDLRAHVEKRGPFPEKVAVNIGRKIAHAVHYAHKKGVIHRDIKPENIVLDREGEPHLMDFGLAREVNSQETRLTKTGMIVGSPEFMAPEQAFGTKEIGPTADVYGLGGVLYYMLTGKPAFQMRDILELLRKVAEEEPTRLTLINPSLGEDIETIIHKCLQKTPKRRYLTAELLEQDLQAVTEGRTIRGKIDFDDEDDDDDPAPHDWMGSEKNWIYLIGSAIGAIFLLMSLILWNFVNLSSTPQGGDKDKSGRGSGTAGKSEEDQQALEDISRALSRLDEVSKDEEKEKALDYGVRLLTQKRSIFYVNRLLEYTTGKENYYHRILAIRCLADLSRNLEELPERKPTEVLSARLHQVMNQRHYFEKERGRRETKELAQALANLNYRGARKLIGKARQEVPQSNQHWDEINLAYQRLASKSKPANHYFEEGERLYQQKKWMAAEYQYSLAISKDGTKFQYYCHRARCLLAAFLEQPLTQRFTGKSQSSLKTIAKDLNKAIGINEQYALAYFLRGRLYFETNQLDLAIQNFQKSNNLNPHLSESLLYLARAQIESSKSPQSPRFQTGMDKLRQLIQMDDKMYQAFLERGRGWKQLGNYTRAAQDFDRAEQIAPLIIEVLHTKSEFLLQTKKPREALQKLKRAQEIAPKEPMTYLLQAQAHADLLNMAKAQSCLKEAMTLQPEGGQVAYIQGLIREKGGDNKRALSYYKKATQFYRTINRWLRPSQLRKYARIHLHMAQIYEILKKYNDAIVQCQKAIQIYPEYLDAHHKKGTLAFHQTPKPNYNLTVETFRDLLRLEKDFIQKKYYIDSLLYIGVSLFHLDQKDKSKTYLKRALKQKDAKSPRRKKLLARAHYYLGFMSRQEGQLPNAVRHYTRALEANPRMADAQFQLGIAHYLEKNFSQAKYRFERTIELDKKNSDAYFYLAKMYFAQSNQTARRDVRSNLLKKAHEYLNLSLANKPPHVDEIYLLRGMVRRNLSFPGDAIQDFSKVISYSRKKTKAKAFLHRGITRYLQKDYNGAKSDLHEAIKANPNQMSEAYFHLGLISQRQGKFQDAVKEYSLTIQKEPGHLKARYNRGRANLELGTPNQRNRIPSRNNLNQAIRDFSYVLRKAPKDQLSRAFRGMAYFHLSQYSESIDDFTEFLKQKPNNTTALTRRAECYYLLGLDYNRKRQTYKRNRQFRKAVSDCTRVIQINNTSTNKNNAHLVKSFYIRGVIYRYMKMHSRAIRDLQSLLTIHPNHKDAKGMRRYIQNYQNR